MSITLKLITDNEGSIHFQELERQVWDSPEDDLVPLHVSVTVARNGGALLGAYADDGPEETGGMVGATLWWLGTDSKVGSGAAVDAKRGGNPLKVCSHMAGVLPEWQGQRIGQQMKLAQRAYVLEQGLTDRITWTFDPLFVPNAIFNMNRLGAICNTYYPNYYGEMRDGLNAGTPSDRCQVDWLLNSPRVASLASGNHPPVDWTQTALQVLPSQTTSSGARVPIQAGPTDHGDPIALPLPEDIGTLRKTDAELALTWRLYVREVLQGAFAAGYMLVDCVNIKNQGHYYILDSHNK